MPLSLVRFCPLERHITVETEPAQANCIYRPWDLPDSAVTPEPHYLRRKEFLRVFGRGLAASALLPPILSISDSNLCVMLHRARMALRECLEMNWFDKPAGGRA
jgi:hypothetical protein